MRRWRRREPVSRGVDSAWWQRKYGVLPAAPRTPPTAPKPYCATSSADRERHVTMRGLTVLVRHELVTGHASHGLKNERVLHAARHDLLGHHAPALFGEAQSFRVTQRFQGHGVLLGFPEPRGIGASGATPHPNGTSSVPTPIMMHEPSFRSSPLPRFVAAGRPGRHLVRRGPGRLSLTVH